MKKIFINRFWANIYRMMSNDKKLQKKQQKIVLFSLISHFMDWLNALIGFIFNHAASSWSLKFFTICIFFVVGLLSYWDRKFRSLTNCNWVFCGWKVYSGLLNIFLKNISFMSLNIKLLHKYQGLDTQFEIFCKLF